MDDVELHLPPDVAYIGLARLVVTVAARQSGMDDVRVEDLKIAVSEATTNAVRAQRHRDGQEPVVLRFGVTGNSFEVSIRDAGAAFDPEQPVANGARDWQIESGLGVTLIRGLADEVVFGQDNGTRVAMRFHLRALDGAGS